jgi:DNA-binding protein HU-beta
MTKVELIAKIAELEGMKKADVERVLNGLGTVASGELVVNGGEVPFPGLGKLVVVATKARAGRNPKNGKPLQIPAGRKAKLRAGKDLTEALKG